MNDAMAARAHTQLVSCCASLLRILHRFYVRRVHSCKAGAPPKIAREGWDEGDRDRDVHTIY